jgi:hypothetical protein
MWELERMLQRPNSYDVVLVSGAVVDFEGVEVD